MRSLPLALLVTLLSACSTQPQHAAPSPMVAGSRPVQPGSAQITPTGSPVPATAGQAHAQTGTPATSPPIAGATPVLAIDPDLVQRGYTPGIRHGERVYCREQAVTGTHFTQKRCQTAEQIKEAAVETKDYLNAQRPDATCAMTKCN